MSDSLIAQVTPSPSFVGSFPQEACHPSLGKVSPSTSGGGRKGFECIKRKDPSCYVRMVSATYRRGVPQSAPSLT